MIHHQLTRTLTVWRPTPVPDGAGGSVTTMTEQPGTVRARVSQPSAAERILAEQGGARHTHAIYLPPSADVRRGDELRTGDGAEVYEVVATIRPSRRSYLRADCELTQAGG